MAKVAIIDGRQIETGADLKCDLCIIGAGAAGIALALELMQTPLSVILLESGGRKLDPQTQELYDGEVADGVPHSPPRYYRKRQFGGTTTVWAGACVPFDPIDFEVRDHIPYSGWPFARAELDRYYPKACKLLEAGDPCFRVSEALANLPREMIRGFVSDRVHTDNLERNSRPTNFAKRYEPELRDAPRVRVLLESNCTHLAVSPEGRAIDRITVATFAGNRFTISARYFVLAAGGLEVTRLLLASRDVRPEGIGNDADLVGRFYMCHLASTVGRLQLHVPGSEVIHAYERSSDRIYCRRHFAIVPELQRELRIGNIILRLASPPIGDPSHRSGALSALFLAHGLLPYERKKWSRGVSRSPALLARHLWNIVADPFQTSAFVSHVFFQRIMASRKYPAVTVKPWANRYSLYFRAEQAPNPESRVRLSEQRDRFGMPRIRVDWHYTDFDVRTVKCAYRVLAEEVARTGVGRLDFSDEELEQAIRRDGAFDGHHIGTTRMSEDPSLGVVDKDCRVHGLGNLFIASASVFPTSSHANPTLTIVAMALRLAAHLRRIASRPTSLAATAGNGMQE
jgi:choline dehydrogenase-like flavoprotein